MGTYTAQDYLDAGFDADDIKTHGLGNAEDPNADDAPEAPPKEVEGTETPEEVNTADTEPPVSLTEGFEEVDTEAVTEDNEEALKEVFGGIHSDDETPQKEASTAIKELEAKEAEFREYASNLLNSNPENTRKVDSVYAPDGRSAYTLTEAELHQYVGNLVDDGRTPEALSLLNEVSRYKEAVTTYNNNVREAVYYNEQLQWTRIENNLLDKVKVPAEQLSKVAALIGEKLKDPKLAQAIHQSMEAKQRLLYTALKESGVLDTLRTPKSPPTLPDSQSPRNHKTTNTKTKKYSEEQILKMSAKEFSKHEQEIMSSFGI